MHTTATQRQEVTEFARPFNVMQAFQTLETNRKMALFDILMVGDEDMASFKRTTEFLWPQASNTDVIQLESFLRRRLNATE